MSRRKTLSSGRGEPLIVYFLLGLVLGVLFIKSEVASWYRIQEMFRFQSFHMYGVIGSAVAVGAVFVLLMKRLGLRSRTGESIDYAEGEGDHIGKEHVLGGTLFGMGWGLLGACPGPIYALVGAGYPVMAVALIVATVGAWCYGLLRPRLPHGRFGPGKRQRLTLAEGRR